MKTNAILLLLLGAGIYAPDRADGQLRSPDRLDAMWRADVAIARGGSASIAPPTAASDPSSLWQAGVSHERIVLGTATGAVLGAALGSGLVALTRGEAADGDMFPWAGLAAGAVLGSVPGMVLGARAASGRRGNPFATGAAAVGGTAIGLVAGIAVGSLLARGDTGTSPEVLGVIVGVAVPIGLTSFVEFRTARR